MDSRSRIYDFRTKIGSGRIPDSGSTISNENWLGPDCGFRILRFYSPPREVMSLPHTLVSVPRRAQRRKYEVGGAS
eukprot:scaffold3186_cov43-Phaeocystis_antarctica.AAC.1